MASGFQNLSFSTPETHGQSVKFSPFSEHRLACVSGTEYGLQGEGFLFVLERNEGTGQLEQLHKMDYRDNLFDVAWSESEPNVLATAGGDGWVQVWNLGSKYPRVPAHEFKGFKNKKEMSSLDWSLPKFSNLLLGCCWDGLIYVYDMALNSPWQAMKITVSDLIVYQAAWSPHRPQTFISVSSDGILQLWDLQADNKKAQIYLSASDNELLCCDWAKYTDHVVATAGTDCVVRGWDLRNYSLPIFQLEDHGHAVKRVKFSPFHPGILASASYDLSVRLFDTSLPEPSLEIMSHHSEFVYGLDWNLQRKGELASCAWDQTIQIFTPKVFQTQD